jgi:hypothetical protein
MEQNGINGTRKNKGVFSCRKCIYECCDINSFNYHLHTQEHKNQGQSKWNGKMLCCNKCNYNCSSQSEFNRHLNTAKHKNQVKTTKNVIEHSCECGKIYATKSGLWKHKRLCSLNKKSHIIENDTPTIMDILSQNKELMNMLTIQNQEHREETSKLQNAILEMIPKMGNNNTTNNNPTNNNQFNLQVFLNEDCKDALNFSEFIEKIQISFDDLENQAENGYVKGISKLFIENLQKLGINKRPIHCTDKKRKTLYIKENDTWDKEGSLDSLKNGIQEVTRRTYCELMKSKAENEEEYRDADSEFSTKCLTIQQNLTPTYPRETSIGKVIEKITQNTGIIEK